MESLKTKEEVKFWLVMNNVKDFEINDDLSVHVKGKLILIKKGLTHLPIRFKAIDGSVNLAENDLTTLEGLPEEIHGYLDISCNRLESLKHCPKIIHGHFICDKNDLKDLQYGPKKIEGFYSCEGNWIHSLSYLPVYVKDTIALDSHILFPGFENLMEQDRLGTWLLFKDFSIVQKHMQTIALKEHFDNVLAKSASQGKRKI